jgi:hypothetical protein
MYLAVIASDLSLTNTAAWNVIVLNPQRITSISVGVCALLLYIGMAIGLALAGAYMENLETIQGVDWLYPSAGLYDLVSLTGGMLL